MEPSLWHSLARSLIGDPELTGPEVASQAGIDMQQARRLWRALGFAPVRDEERVFALSDVAVLRAIRALLDQRDAEPEVLLQLTRVNGQSLARIAEAQVASSADRLAPRGGGLTGGAEVAAVAERITGLVPQLEPFLGYVWRRHLLAALFRFAAARGNEAGVGNATVGFADLVGFTAMSQQLTERELAAMVDRFEALAYEHILERGGRVVKMIGDEVMFAVDDACAAAETALALAEAYAGDDALPDVRVGLATGPTLSWEGDLFGPTVNFASRLVNLARPATVLISDDLASELRERSRFALRALRPLSLKGIGRVRVWVLRRAPLDSTSSGSPRRSAR